MKTTISVKTEDANRQWWVVDLNGQVLGRAASRIANVLRGKHKPSFTPHNDTGDFVVVINAEKLVLTGRKAQQKFYYRHTTHPGGIRGVAAHKMLDEHPERLLEIAVRGMMPRGPLGRRMFRKLKVYSGGVHPHQAQQPRVLDLTKI
jgi:large subunit ribosomal protein L13